VKTLKIERFSCLRLIRGFLIFAPLVKTCGFLSVLRFDYVQARGLAFDAE